MVSHKVCVFYWCRIPVDGELVLSFNFSPGEYGCHVGSSQMLDGGPLSLHGEKSLKGSFFPGCLFYHPSLCTLLHFLVLFNDFQPFIIQRKAGSRRLWLNQCPLSLARSPLLLSHYSVRFTFPFLLPPHFLFFCHSLASLSFIPALSGQ